MNAISRTSALSAVPLLIAALALSACGSSDDSTSSASSATATSTGGETVSTADIDGVGAVLVDSNGDALYTPDQEANGKIMCTGSCEQIWMPLEASGMPTASSNVSGDVGTVKRPDGSEQVTLDGAPLYTFAEDSPGQATGDGVSDSFEGKDFTWHAITAGGSAPDQTTTTDSSSSGGGYDY